MSFRPEPGAEWVRVRLSQVPEHKRLKAAERLIEEEGLVGIPEILMRMAALNPVQDPSLRVRRTKLRLGGVRA